MSPPPPLHAPQTASHSVRLPGPVEDKPRLPAWLLSLTLHLALLITLAALLRTTPQGAAVEPDRTGGIVLVENEQGEPKYMSQPEGTERSEPQRSLQASSSAQEAASSQRSASPQNSATDRSSSDASSKAAVNEALPGPQQLPEAPSASLPSLPTTALNGSDFAAALPDAGGLTAGGGGSSRAVGDYEVETGVFGVTGKGSKFVYVFDRSGSMEGFQGRPLAAAKRELIASLQALESTHQFQIIFYNEQPQAFNPFHPQRPRMVFADGRGKRLAERFVRGIVAHGGTRHMDALKIALGMHPDVIFFLTDAAEPRLSDTELQQIRRRNARVGASINAIEFGSGRYNGSVNFLVQLARQNGGKHTYVNVAQLPLGR